MLVSCTFDRFLQACTVNDGKRSGRTRVARANSAIKTVCKRNRRNPLKKSEN